MIEAMELYYSPLSCSAAAHIVAVEAGLPLTLRRTDLATKRVDGPLADLRDLNPIGKVPTLVCDDGLVLTESVAVLLFLGDQSPPDRRLMPPHASPARYEVVKWLSFVATELHKRVHAQIFALDPPPEAVKQFSREAAAQPLSVLEAHLRDRAVLVGDAFTVADAYLVWALTILPFGGVPLDPSPSLRAYHERHVARDAVRTVLKAERREYQELAASRAE
jgi:glutathione S-transferase